MVRANSFLVHPAVLNALLQFQSTRQGTRMIAYRSLFRVDRFLKYSSPHVQPGLYAYNGWSLNANMTGKKEYRIAVDQKKKRTTFSQAWRPVCTHASPSEVTVDVISKTGAIHLDYLNRNNLIGKWIVHDVDLLVKDDRVESEDGSQVQEMHYRMHSSTVSAKHVIEVAEETNIVTDSTAGSSASTNKDGDTILEGQSVPSGEKFSVKLDVGSSLIRFVKGKGGSTQEKIEVEMGVKIMIPSSKKEEFVVIEGHSVDSVTKASEKIKSIIDEAIKSPSLDYSHFVSLPLAIHPELVEKLFNFQNSILGSSACLDEVEDSDMNEDNTDNEVEAQQTVKAPDVAVELKVDNEREKIKVNINIPLVNYPPKASKTSTPSDLGIDKSIFIKPKTFHLTVLMLKLWNKERVDAASEVLRGISSKIMEALDNKPIRIRLKGLDCMRGSLAKARVVYAPVEEIDDDERLLRVCQVIIDAFSEAGLVLEKDAKQKLKLHATVMNSRHRKRYKGKKKLDSFDAREIFKQYGSEDWGEYHIREAHLSQRFAFDENGYYHCCASIPFPEHMQVD